MVSTVRLRNLQNFGVEIIGVDLAKTPDPQTVNSIQHLWADNGVVLFREQKLEGQQIVEFSRAFGRLEIHVREEYLSKEHPELLLVSNVEEDGKPIGILSNREVGWHHDQMYPGKV